MAIAQVQSRRKPTGGRYKRASIKIKKANLGTAPAHTKLGPTKKQKVRIRNGSRKTLLLYAEKINVFDPKTKKYSVEVIKTISANPANSQFVRRNIMTKGAIVETAKGKVRITSRPGQEATITGILLE